MDLIVDAGDESEFGTAAELTPEYLQAMASVAAQTPIVWIPGNHDSPTTVEVVSTVPGVTVLGSKTATEAEFEVQAGVVSVLGLTIAGLGDPRVYGGSGPFGADDADVTDPLQREAVRQALEGSAADDEGGTTDASPDPVDLFVVHEPVAAQEVRTVLGDRVRQTVSGHTHAQNDSADLQDAEGALDLVEGTTGAGGLDNVVRGVDRPPIQFSIQSVSADCQFTRVVRFSIASAATAAPSDASSYGDDVTVSTVYFRPQTIEGGRRCGADREVGSERPWAGEGS